LKKIATSTSNFFEELRSKIYTNPQVVALEEHKIAVGRDEERN